MVDPLLLNSKKQLVLFELNGIVGRGDYKPQHPHVVALSGTTAVVQDCVYSTNIEVYVKTGQPVPDQPGGTQPQDIAVQTTLTEVSPGKWLASAQQEEMGKCAPGY